MRSTVVDESLFTNAEFCSREKLLYYFKRQQNEKPTPNVNDTFVIWFTEQKEQFLQHINNTDNAIKYTVEDTRENGSVPFLDILVTPEHNGTLVTSVYSKATHTDQYLHWNSHHHIEDKYSIINTLTHRVKTGWSTPELFRREIQHMGDVLTKCKHLSWAIDGMECKTFQHNTPNNTGNKKKNNTYKGYIVILYVKSLCKSIKGICGKYGINTYYRGNRTIKNILLFPRTKTPCSINGIIYWYRSDRINCDEYLGESAITLWERYKEHLKALPIQGKKNTTCHQTTMDNFSIVGREGHGFDRTSKESIYIRVNNPIININIGK